MLSDPYDNGFYCFLKTPLQIEEGSGVTSRKGLTVLTAMLFVVGDVAGGGLLTFPKALSQIGE